MLSEQTIEQSDISAVSHDLSPSLEMPDLHTAELRMALQDLARAQEAIRASEAKYRGLTENTLDILLALDSQGIITFIGPQCNRYGWNPEKKIGQQLRQLVLPEDRERAMRDLQDAVDNNRMLDIEFRIHDTSGRIHWLAMTGTKQLDVKGKSTGVTGALRDITRRKEAEIKLAEREERLRKLAASLASAQDEEQRRIADGLHDDIAQLLAACSFKVALIERRGVNARIHPIINELQEILAEAGRKIRSLTFELGSSLLLRLGLKEALAELCDSMQNRYDVTFHMITQERIPLREETATVLFKATRELLFNIVKHSQASQGTVSMSANNKQVTLIVEDNGNGFPQVAGEVDLCRGHGLGLFGIRERLADIGGHMQIISEPGVRTRVVLRAPLL